MKNKKMYLDRLAKLARHLIKKDKQDIFPKQVNRYWCDNRGANIEYFSWALEGLPKIFPQWEYDQDNNPILTSNPRLNTLTATGDWFGLNFDSLMHLFVPGYQNPIYGGNMLSENSRPGELVSNIYEFIKIMEMEEEETVYLLVKKKQRQQKEKVYNLKNNYYEERDNFVSRMRA
jgi:hypothetical protein